MYILYIDVNSMKKSGKIATDSVDKSDIGFEKEDIQFSAKDMYAIQDIHQQPNLFRLIVNSLCPGIFGHELVKGKLNSVLINFINNLNVFNNKLTYIYIYIYIYIFNSRFITYVIWWK